MPSTSQDTPTEQPQPFVLFEPDSTQQQDDNAGEDAGLWCPLDARGLLRVDGEDAEAFLQGQLSQDMARVRAGAVLLAAHCTPKGRVTALFRAWHDGEAFWLDCPAELEAAAQRRLAMYVLRSRVRIQADRAGWLRTGLCAGARLARLEALTIALPETPGEKVRAGPHWVARLAGTGARWLLLSPHDAGALLRAELASRLGAADPAGWALARLRAGEPEVLPETTEAFIPQMLNLDELDGVSFRKGCYTGQEIVARTHYLGRVKRRMLQFAWSGAGQPVPGAMLAIAPGTLGPGTVADAVAATEVGSAQLVWALRTRDDGGEALAVTQVPAEAAATHADRAQPVP